MRSVTGRLIVLRRTLLSSSPTNCMYKSIRTLKDPELREHDLLCTRVRPIFTTARQWLKQTREHDLLCTRVQPIFSSFRQWLERTREHDLLCSMVPPIFSTFRQWLTNTSSSIPEECTKSESKEVEEECIEKGDTINLNEILFTENRDYLVKNNNEQVKAVHLKGKVIGIYFLPLPLYDEYIQWTKGVTTLIMDVYNDLLPDNNFEVVFVARTDSFKQSDSQKHFEAVFSYMPWTAIPFSDITSRESLERRFGVSQKQYIHPYMFVIVDPTGKVLQCEASRHLIDYGALGYPFSDKRIKYLREEDDATAKQPSLKNLLASPKRDYVISSQGDKVPIHRFEDKVVALYFYKSTPSNNVLLKELKLAYEELAKVKNFFEVVLIYSREPGDVLDLPTSEESFWETFRKMPWLALPFKDPRCKKLNRMFKKLYDDVFSYGGLVIFGPYGVESYCTNTLLQYNIQEYLLTRKEIVELKTEEVEEVKLNMLWDPDTVFKRKDGSKVPFSQLAGKRIVLVLEHDGSAPLVTHSVNLAFLWMLKEKYLQMKGTDNEFEVIRIQQDDKESNLSEGYVGDMPWFISLESELLHVKSDIWWNDLPIDFDCIACFPVCAFGKDGRLVKKTKNPYFKDCPYFEDMFEYDNDESLYQLCSLRVELLTRQR